MIRKILTLAAIPAAAIALAAPAMANVSPTKVITSNGEAGYYASTNGPGRFVDVRTRFYLRNEAKSLTTAAGEGVQLCNESTGNAVQLGFRWTGTAFQALVGSGTLVATPGTHTTACNSGGALLGVPLVPNLLVPQGHNVHLILHEVSPGVFEAFAKDTTDSISASKSFAGLSFPDVASAGVVQDISTRSAPANLKIVKFHSTRVTMQNHPSGYLGTSLLWTSVQAYSNHTGDNSNPAIITPASSLVNGRFFVFAGAQTGP